MPITDVCPHMTVDTINMPLLLRLGSSFQEALELRPLLTPADLVGVLLGNVTKQVQLLQLHSTNTIKLNKRKSHFGYASWNSYRTLGLICRRRRKTLSTYYYQISVHKQKMGTSAQCGSRERPNQTVTCLSVEGNGVMGSRGALQLETGLSYRKLLRKETISFIRKASVET